MAARHRPPVAARRLPRLFACALAAAAPLACGDTSSSTDAEPMTDSSAATASSSAPGGVPAAASGAAPPAPAPAAEVPDALARLVPAEALVFVRFASVAEVEAFLRGVVRPFDEREAQSLSLARLFADLDVPGDLGRVDPDEPFGLALNVDRDTDEVHLTVVAAPRDREGWKASVRLLTQAEDGEYVGASQVPGYARGDVASPLAAHMPAGAVSVRVDLAGLLRIYRPRLDVGAAGLFNLMRAQARGVQYGVDASTLFDAYEELLAAVLDSCDWLDVGLSIQDGRLDATTEFWAVPGSPLGTLGSDEPTDIARYAGMLPPGEQAVCVYGADMPALTERLAPFMDAFVGATQGAGRSPITDMMGQWKQAYGLLGSCGAASMSFAEDGMRIAQVFEATDAEALFDVYREAYTNEAVAGTGALIGEPEESHDDGRHTLRVTVDLMGMMGDTGVFAPRMPGESEAEHAERLQAMVDVLESMYGKGGMTMRLVAEGDRVALVAGGDEAWATETLAHLAEGDVPTALAREVARVERLNPCLVLQADLGALIGAWMRLFGRIIDPALAPVGTVPSATMTASLGVAGRIWKGHAMVDLAALGRAAEAFGPR